MSLSNKNQSRASSSQIIWIYILSIPSVQTLSGIYPCRQFGFIWPHSGISFSDISASTQNNVSKWKFICDGFSSNATDTSFQKSVPVTLDNPPHSFPLELNGGNHPYRKVVSGVFCRRVSTVVSEDDLSAWMWKSHSDPEEKIATWLCSSFQAYWAFYIHWHYCTITVLFLFK